MRPPINSRINKKEFLRKWLSFLRLYNNNNSSSSNNSSSPANQSNNINKQTTTPTTPSPLSTLLERKRAIKISADIAMASTRIATSRWSRALISNISTTTDHPHNITPLHERHHNHIVSPAHNADNTTTTTTNHGDGGSRRQQQQQGRSQDQEPTNSAKRSIRFANRRKRRRSMAMVRKRMALAAAAGPTEKGRMRARKIASRVVKKRTEVLRALVPGGKEMDECCLIREAVDYILSLRAQVDVMQHLADATETHNKNNNKLMLNNIGKSNNQS